MVSDKVFYLVAIQVNALCSGNRSCRAAGRHKNGRSGAGVNWES